MTVKVFTWMVFITVIIGLFYNLITWLCLRYFNTSFFLYIVIVESVALVQNLLTYWWGTRHGLK